MRQHLVTLAVNLYYMYNQWEHYEVIDGKAYAVVFRDKGDDRIRVCPFCNLQHSHSEGEGHRNTHCRSDRHFEEVVASDGTIMKQIRGYIIREL